MRNLFLLYVLIFFAASGVKAQKPVQVKEVRPVVAKDSVIQKTDTLKNQKQDTLKKKRPAYINPGKVAGKRALLRSLIVPGLGQIGSGITVYRFAKVAGIYTGATMLTLSYMENSKNYNLVLEELKYRAEHGNTPNPDGVLQSRQNDGLILAKDTFRRNKEVIIFSFIGLYLLNAIDAYVDARLKYFDVGDIAFKVSPGLIDANTPLYSFNAPVPGLKLTVKF